MIQKLEFNPNTAAVWQKCLEKDKSYFPFSTYTWHEIWAKHLEASDSSHVLYLPQLNIIAPLTLRGTQTEFLAGRQVSDYCDLIGPAEQKEPAWSEILTFLKDKHIGRIILWNVPESSPTLAFFRSATRKNLKNINIVYEDTTPTIQLPVSFSQYLSSLPSKYRHELRRKLRKFERDYSQIRIRLSSDPMRDIEFLFKLMRLDSQKKVFLTAEMEQFFRDIAAAFGSSARLYLLTVSDLPASAVLTFTTGKSMLLYNSGFDETRFSGAGFYLKAKLIHKAIEEGFRSFNFLQGNERYKYELGGLDYKLYTISADLIP